MTAKCSLRCNRQKSWGVVPIAQNVDNRSPGQSLSQPVRGFHLSNVGLCPPAVSPPPWSVEELDTCFVVRDHRGQALAYVYFEDERAKIDGKACGAYLVVLGLSIICFMKSIAASGVG
jgi:hypothetical protein